MDMEETTNKETNILLDQHSAGTVSMRKKKQHQLHEVQDQEEYLKNEAFSEEDEPEQPSSSIGTISSSSKCIHSFSKYTDKIFASHTIKIKVNTGADTCILSENQMQLLPFKLKIKITNTILKRYECSRITNIVGNGLKIIHKNQTIRTRLYIIKTTQAALCSWMQADTRTRNHLST